ncbi:hypothetical protein ACUH95_06150 [Dermabacteraceae bacterium P13101]
MSCSFIVLSEVELSPADAQRAVRLLGCDGDEECPLPSVRIVVPAVTQRSLVAEVIDDLALFRIDLAARDLAARMRGDQLLERSDSARVLESCQDAFKRIGCEVVSAECEENALAAVSSGVDDCETQTVVVFTMPQLVEETLELDWAHLVEDALNTSVVHLYPGYEGIGS